MSYSITGVVVRLITAGAPIGGRCPRGFEDALQKWVLFGGNMVRFNGTRLRSERGSVSSLVILASLFAAITFIGSQIVPLTVRLQDSSEIDGAFTLATPQSIRAGITDSAGHIKLLDEDSVRESIVRHLQTFRRSIRTEETGKQFCAAVFDLGEGEACTQTGTIGLGPFMCPRPVYAYDLGTAIGWRHDGSECHMSLDGPVVTMLLIQGWNDSGANGRWDRYYIIIRKLDDANFVQARRIDTAPRLKAVSLAAWSPSSGPTSTLGHGAVNPIPPVEN